MIILLCKTQFTGDAPLSEWQERLARMRTIVSGMPGFINVKAYFAPDGDWVAIYKFDSEEALDAWHNHPEHVETQQRAREAFYQSLYILASREIKEYSFEPEEAPSPVIILMWKKLSPEGEASVEYQETVETMRATVSDKPGHISWKTYVDGGTLKTLLGSKPLTFTPDARFKRALEDYSAGDRETVTVMKLESEEALNAWRNCPENWEPESPYRAHEMQVCKVLREYGFTREDGSEPIPVPCWYTSSGGTRLVPAASHKVKYQVRRYLR